ncbi:MAG: ArsR/SmtB family transcription factor [Candidatus Promineifilaceae bacterium]
MNAPSPQELDLLHSNICQALGDPKRILILYEIYNAPRNVTALAQDLRMPQPTVSRHLRVLRQRALVRPVRDGASVVYHLTDSRMIKVLDNMRLILRDSLSRQSSFMQQAD